MDTPLALLFTDASARRLVQFRDRIEACLVRLTADQIWLRGSDSENAVGNLILHLSGNVRQWIVSAIGGAPDVRVRDQEFAARGPIPAVDLMGRLSAAIDEAVVVIRGLDSDRLGQRISVQAYDVTVLEAVQHVVEHFALHTGQILFATKLMTQQDLGFYRHISRNTHSEKTP